MPMNAPAASTEVDQLLAFLAHQRSALRNACHGLDEVGLRATPTPSTMSVGGLLKHAEYGERGWVERLSGPRPGDTGSAEEGMAEYVASFALADGETLATVTAASERTAQQVEAAFRAEPDLDRLVELPPAPWLPQGAITVRWVLIHLVEELARHAGHADLLRESLDGAASGPLMAAVEGWPEDGWITPWKPAA